MPNILPNTKRIFYSRLTRSQRRAHNIGGLPLAIQRQMRVYVKGCADLFVTKELLYLFHVRALL